MRWNAVVVTEAAGPIQIDPGIVGSLELEGFSVPYVDGEDWPGIHARVVVDGAEHTYARSFPVHGHSAVMPAAIDELRRQGKQVLVVERTERYYVYVA